MKNEKTKGRALGHSVKTWAAEEEEVTEEGSQRPEEILEHGESSKSSEKVSEMELDRLLLSSVQKQ